MSIRRKLPGLQSITVAALTMLLAGPVAAQQKTEITFARFFGACEGDYGTSQDVAHARGECGVMTTLVNLFNATNKDNIVVKPQMYTLTVGLASMQTNFAQTEGIGFLMAQAVFAGLPVLILYLFFQRHIISAVSGGAAR